MIGSSRCANPASGRANNLAICSSSAEADVYLPGRGIPKNSFNHRSIQICMISVVHQIFGLISYTTWFSRPFLPYQNSQVEMICIIRYQLPKVTSAGLSMRARRRSAWARSCRARLGVPLRPEDCLLLFFFHFPPFWGRADLKVSSRSDYLSPGESPPFFKVKAKKGRGGARWITKKNLQ